MSDAQTSTARLLVSLEYHLRPLMLAASRGDTSVEQVCIQLTSWPHWPALEVRMREEQSRPSPWWASNEHALRKRAEVREFVMHTLARTHQLLLRYRICHSAFVLSLSRLELVEVASALFAPLMPPHVPDALDGTTSIKTPPELWRENPTTAFLETVFTDAGADGVPIGLKWVSWLDPAPDNRRQLFFEAFRRFGLLRVMQQPRNGLLLPTSTSDWWVELLRCKTEVCRNDVARGVAHRWPLHPEFVEYRVLRHYASIDRFFMRRRLWNVTTHAKVWNRDVIDTILEFVFGVFTTERNFFRNRFTVTKVALTD